MYCALWTTQLVRFCNKFQLVHNMKSIANYTATRLFPTDYTFVTQQKPQNDGNLNNSQVNLIIFCKSCFLREMIKHMYSEWEIYLVMEVSSTIIYLFNSEVKLFHPMKKLVLLLILLPMELLRSINL